MNIATTEFKALGDLIESRSGIVLESGKEYLAEARLTPILENHRIADVTALMRKMLVDKALEREVINALTTNETSFFRDQTPFRFLKTIALPAIAERMKKGGPGPTIWSAASSTGQEAYSVAMIIREDFPDMMRTARIVGTDLNSSVVERARAGKFTQLEVNRGLPAPSLIKHFSRAGTEWQIAPELKAIVDFRVHNLLEEFRPPSPVDVVLCRNVLIYFSMSTRHRLLGRIASVMRKGGWMLVGASEAGSVPTPPFRGEIQGGIQVFLT
jgi:chemotaxis protein methyltransferase CheR